MARVLACDSDIWSFMVQAIQASGFILQWNINYIVGSLLWACGLIATVVCFLFGLYFSVFVGICWQLKFCVCVSRELCMSGDL